MSRVFILGAGATSGEHFHPLLQPEPEGAAYTTPPLINGFFRKELLDGIGYAAEHLQRDFAVVVDYIRYLKQLGDDVVGEGEWNNINLEEIFTAIELEREFQGRDSDNGARLTIWRNQLIRFIARILAFCTQDLYGEYVRHLVEAL